MSIEVITSEDFNNFDLDEIKQLFNGLDLKINIDNQRMVRRSIEPPPAIWIVISIITVLIAQPFFSGFFHKMGEDAYENFKGAVKEISKKRKSGQDTQLRIHVKKDKNMITVTLPTDSDNLKIALNALPEFLDANSDLNGWINFDHGKWKRS